MPLPPIGWIQVLIGDEFILRAGLRALEASEVLPDTARQRYRALLSEVEALSSEAPPIQFADVWAGREHA